MKTMKTKDNSFKIYKTFNLNNLSDDERKTIDLIVNIIDTGNQNNTLGLILSIIGTGIGATSTTITCAATVPTLGASSMACYGSIVLTTLGITSTVISINDNHQNEIIVNKYIEQLKTFNDITIKDEL